MTWDPEKATSSYTPIITPQTASPQAVSPSAVSRNASTLLSMEATQGASAAIQMALPILQTLHDSRHQCHRGSGGGAVEAGAATSSAPQATSASERVAAAATAPGGGSNGGGATASTTRGGSSGGALMMPGATASTTRGGSSGGALMMPPSVLHLPHALSVGMQPDSPLGVRVPACIKNMPEQPLKLLRMLWEHMKVSVQ
jgi:hypothetical protein